jgi:hypothetical protein
VTEKRYFLLSACSPPKESQRNDPLLILWVDSRLDKDAMTSSRNIPQSRVGLQDRRLSMRKEKHAESRPEKQFVWLLSTERMGKSSREEKTSAPTMGRPARLGCRASGPWMFAVVKAACKIQKFEKSIELRREYIR